MREASSGLTIRQGGDEDASAGAENGRISLLRGHMKPSSDLSRKTKSSTKGLDPVESLAFKTCQQCSNLAQNGLRKPNNDVILCRRLHLLKRRRRRRPPRQAVFLLQPTSRRPFFIRRRRLGYFAS